MAKDMSPAAVASRRGRRNKQKGRQFERAVAQVIMDFFGLPETDVLNSRSGKKEPDIHMSAAAYEQCPLHLEAKNSKTLSIPAWIRQAEADAASVGSEGRPYPATPVVVFKQHGDSQMYAVVDFKTLLAFVKGSRLCDTKTPPSPR